METNKIEVRRYVDLVSMRTRLNAMAQILKYSEYISEVSNVDDIQGSISDIVCDELEDIVNALIQVDSIFF